MADATGTFIERIATQLNKFIDIPVLPEGVEQEALVLAITGLEHCLPPSYRNLVESTLDGISDEEAAADKEWIAKQLVERGHANSVVADLVAGAIVKMAQNVVKDLAA